VTFLALLIVAAFFGSLCCAPSGFESNGMGITASDHELDSPDGHDPDVGQICGGQAHCSGAAIIPMLTVAAVDEGRDWPPAFTPALHTSLILPADRPPNPIPTV